MSNSKWQPVTMSALRARLAEVRDLLQQAAAVGLAQDVARLDTLAELERRGGERADAKPRRYR